jgi:hypothetical protein
VPLRAPETVLNLARMGSFHQTRLSFMRVLLRRLKRNGWQVARAVWEIDVRGEGVAVYQACGEGRTYSLVAFGHDLDPAKRTDRVIAEAWDATFALHDGVVSRADIERLAGNVPRQEAGRLRVSELVLARANRSVRLFDHVVACLAGGRQPAEADLDAVGYLMRTTAVYGSGKFGMADREQIADRPEFAGTFAAEMLTVWLIRLFTTDLVEHMAALRSPRTAVRLKPALRRRLGVGNSTGLGMAPFVVNHPGLFHRWIEARETALARVRSLETASEAEIEFFLDRFARGRQQVAAWRTDDDVQTARIRGLQADLERLNAHIEAEGLSSRFPWQALHAFSEAELGLEAQEFLVTLLLEPHGALIDDLANGMGGDESADFPVDGAQTVRSLRADLEGTYGFAIATDFSRPEAQARFWYVSVEKLEPRLGERASEEGAEREQPLGIGRDVARLHEALTSEASETTVADFLSAHPEYRHSVRRVQLAARRPYAEIRDNLLAATMRPIDILRCKLSFFGATNFDPRSDRWVRIALFRHAPFPDELHDMDSDDWAIPPLSAGADSSPALRGADSPISSDSARHLGGFSLNETQAELRKAARGAGLHWGLADEVGRAARALAHASPDALSALADALEAVESGSHSTEVIAAGAELRAPNNRPLSPLVLGPALADRASLIRGTGVAVGSPVPYPSLLGSALTEIAERLGLQLVVRAGGEKVEVGSDLGALLAGLNELDTGNGIFISASPASTLSVRARRPASPVQIADDLWRRFTRLAALTYVPDSDRSRLAGAGAGLNDND